MFIPRVPRSFIFRRSSMQDEGDQSSVSPGAEKKRGTKRGVVSGVVWSCDGVFRVGKRERVKGSHAVNIAKWLLPHLTR